MAGNPDGRVFLALGHMLQSYVAVMTMTLQQLYEPIQAELRQVQGEVSRHWSDALALVRGPSGEPVQAGGKLLRPALCLLAAGASGARDLAAFVPLATACELLHVAALAHDDVVDHADRRRGSASLNALWDDRTAVLSGDYLVARSIALMASYQSCGLILNTTKALQRMTEGELSSFGKRSDTFTQQDCIELAERKTAIYFAVTCCSPTYLVGEAWRKAFEQYAMAFGVAFQIIDDVLDIAQHQDALGKPSCGDIVEGKQTLPLLFLRDALDAAGRERLSQLVGRPLDDQDRRWAADALKDTGAKARAEAVARRYADTACLALETLPSTAHKEAMRGLAEFILVRHS